MDVNGHGNGGVQIGHDGIDIGVNGHPTANSNSGDVKLAADIDGSPVNAGDVDIADGQGGGRVGTDINGHGNGGVQIGHDDIGVDVDAQNNGGDDGLDVADVLHDEKSCNCED